MADPEWMGNLRRFCTLLEAEDYDGALPHAPSLLSSPSCPDDGDPVRRAVLNAHVRCLLETEDFAQLRQVLEQNRLQEELWTTYQYALYRLKDYKSMEDLSSDQMDAASPIQKHLMAQKYYQLNKSSEALNLYLDLVRDCSDDREALEQLLVNTAALLVAHAVPHVRTPHSPEGAILDFLSDAGSDAADLVYNYAMLLFVQGEPIGRKVVQSGLTNAPSTPQDHDDLTKLLDWSALYLSGSSNPSLCIPATPIGKRTAWQSQLVSYNAAVELLRQRRFAECHKAAKELVPRSGSGAAHPHHPLWWNSRVAVLQAHCDKSKANDVLRSALERLQGSSRDEDGDDAASAVRDAAWLYLESHRAELAGEKLEASRLPSSLRSSNGVLATLARQQGGGDGSSSMPLTTAQRADHLLSSKEYAAAATFYRHLYDEDSYDPQRKARLVTALSHTDPEAAIKLWSEDPTLRVATTLDDASSGAALEQQELPRLKASSSRSQHPEGGSGAPPKRTREQVLQRRAKKRDAYLSQLEAKGAYRRDRPTQPDPERWLPRVERAHGGRRKRGGTKASAHNRGAQGGISEKEAARLDVAARQAEGAAGSHYSGAPSTAHISATSGITVGGRKTGRRK